jgi:tellurite resistance protein TehA-like permease
VTTGIPLGRKDPVNRDSRRRRRAAGLPPTAGAAVMSTGILSSASHAAGLRWLSWVLLALAGLGEVALGAALAARALDDRPGFVADAGTPAALTGVAATAVLGSGLASLGRPAAAGALLGVSTLLWLVLLPVVLWRWRVPTVGASFLVCVATEGLAVLAGVLGRVTGNRPLLAAGWTACALGVVLYGVVVARFDWRQLAVGRGDHWVLAGALAITSLALAELLSSGGGTLLHRLDVAVWALAVAGYALLVGCELRWPRPRYDIRRWATVFPMGMTAAASFAVARTDGLPALRGVGHVLLWPALAAWCLTAAGAARRQLRR